ncbi:pyridoxine/pyridoxal/pyridoxamine kinase [Bordetella avium]|uniref:Pyridoxine/pyridoxal/pyridoxamine kinase n=1 Tax=Bordetella avium (strain 197N) TaxID=360910 RepID=PDXK_BORA1|nr:pyridoxine/pyridoxal/pyridoxamine kinase [Bordetella avium]Q2L1P5.1 RecName: Full=Pyridoxine/pyridoxal/pyridoxamine kinase; Short=PN/PL/PM kinase; AltName: Full=B6-vitamer kinase [Bordetella avium 197N]AZY48985.1 pyridoxine kinase [Bordetella avium]AZY52346.1 pyridoxine kinase [Bordetella avium]RIQ14228.1 pyridoxine/pyridoxal/pyridoxamine kinase [Bordetella avium]RIQ18104.1 pyridoxine/pyridoxal/pyridoxamine kinase [Bordetella avium]RIQ36576.1 pyridoxine/pyridoxal/pyridoxamine kinase [Borde
MSSGQGYVASGRPLLFDVVSVQSQVVYGHVGNNVAAPALRAHGLHPGIVPTVLLSNTPHYPTLHGGALPLSWFEGYLQDLQARGALQALRAILVGYLGSAEQARVLGRWIARIREVHPQVLVIVDPVMGDDDHGLYVTEGLAEASRECLVPQAHGLTPNSFELGLLTGCEVGRVDQAVAAARRLLAQGLRWVVVTSAAQQDCPPGQVQLLAVTASQAHLLRHQRVDTAPKGTGDLFCAELTAHLLAGASLERAVEASSRYLVQALACTRLADSAELLMPSRDPAQAQAVQWIPLEN